MRGGLIRVTITASQRRVSVAGRKTVSDGFFPAPFLRGDSSRASRLVYLGFQPIDDM